MTPLEAFVYLLYIYILLGTVTSGPLLRANILSTVVFRWDKETPLNSTFSAIFRTHTDHFGRAFFGGVSETSVLRFG